jgi:hypothetical protein
VRQLLLSRRLEGLHDGVVIQRKSRLRGVPWTLAQAACLRIPTKYLGCHQTPSPSACNSSARIRMEKGTWAGEYLVARRGPAMSWVLFRVRQKRTAGCGIVDFVASRANGKLHTSLPTFPFYANIRHPEEKPYCQLEKPQGVWSSALVQCAAPVCWSCYSCLSWPASRCRWWVYRNRLWVWLQCSVLIVEGLRNRRAECGRVRSSLQVAELCLKTPVPGVQSPVGLPRLVGNQDRQGPWNVSYHNATKPLGGRKAGRCEIGLQFAVLGTESTSESFRSRLVPWWFACSVPSYLDTSVPRSPQADVGFQLTIRLPARQLRLWNNFTETSNKIICSLSASRKLPLVPPFELREDSAIRTRACALRRRVRHRPRRLSIGLVF